jgi:hypothetical protein
MVQARHRLWAWGLIVGGVAAWLLVGRPAYAADSPTVTFTAPSLLGLACGSRPDVGSVSVSEGASVVIANQAGMTARVVVAGQTVLTLDNGAVGRLTLAPGRHDVLLIPQCLLVVGTSPLTVTVTPAAVGSGPAESEPAGSGDEPASGSDAPPPAGGPAAPTDPVTADGVAAGPRSGPRPKRAPDGTPLPVSSGVPSASTTATAPPLSRPTGVVEAEAIPWTKPVDPKGVRLLAAIAAICVLGVTAAIIRSIVRLDA